MIPAGGDMACVDISITDDDSIEGDQTFTVTVAIVTTGMNVMLGSPITTTVTITDDDSNVTGHIKN